jgi:branched-chain amino acid transport system substrate-binding protein
MRRALLVLVILSLVSSVSVACGPKATPTPTPVPEPTATPVPEPIKIGATVSLTGKYADSGKYYEQAYRLWEEEVNAGGGFLGRPIEMTIYDDKSDPDTGVSLYEKLITVDKVDLILGPYTSSVIYPVSGVAEKYKMLFLQGGGNSPKLFERGFKYMFLTLPGLAADFPRMMMRFLESLPEAERPQSSAVLFLDNEAMVAEAEGLMEELETLGIQVVYDEKVPEGVTDLTTTMAKVKESGAEVLFGHFFLPEGVLAVRAAKQLDYSPKAMWFSVGPAMIDWIETLEDDANYVWGSTMFLTKAQTPGLEEFVSSFQGKWDRPPDYHAAGAYAAAQVLQSAVEATQSLDNDVLRDYVAANEFPTVIGTLSWDETGKPEPAVLLIQWIDGEQEILWPPEAATADPVYPMPAWAER